MSGELQEIVNTTGDDFRSLSNTNENSGMTAEMGRIINSELTSQISRKLDEIKMDLNSQISQTIDSTIADKVLPQVQNCLVVLQNGRNEN